MQTDCICDNIPLECLFYFFTPGYNVSEEVGNKVFSVTVTMLDCCYGEVFHPLLEMDSWSLTTGRSPFSLSSSSVMFPKESSLRESAGFLLDSDKNKTVSHFHLGRGKVTKVDKTEQLSTTEADMYNDLK